MASEPPLLDVDPAELVGMTTLFPPSQLSTFSRNARIGDVDAIMVSLKVHGQFKPIVVNVGTHTGRPCEVLAGNHTLKAFRKLAEQSPSEQYWNFIKVHWVDVEDEMATRIALADNRSFEQGEGFDPAALLALLDEVGIEGTGYAEADLDALEEAMAAHARNSGGSDAGPGDPEPPSLPPASDPAIGFTVVFDDEDQQNAWFEFIKWLRDRYPDLETVAERLTAHLTDTAGDRA